MTAWSTRSVGAAVYVLPAALLILLDRSALSKPPWSDEWATWQFSQLGFGQLWRATSHVDRDLLPFYALVHVLRMAGAGIALVRMLSLACGVVAVVATQLVAGRVWDRLAALVAGLAVAANPVVGLWASQARPPAMAYAVVGIGTLLVVRWSRASRIAYPVVVTVGALVFPPTVLVVPAQLLWRWRASGLQAALRTLATIVPGVVAVAAWELHSVGQVGELLVASDATPHAAAVTIEHALGGVDGLPWLHAAALIAAGVVVACHRAAGHAVALRGLALAILLVEGCVLLAWLATAVGVPMLADNLVTGVPLGAALLLGGLVGHPWFPARSADTNTDADVGTALRGGIAAASLVSLTLAALWWTHRSGSEVSLDGMDIVATSLAGEAKVGDLLLVQEPYAVGSYAYSLAAAMGDTDFRSTLQRQLPAGARHLVVRRITRVEPSGPLLVTKSAHLAHRATRVWVIHLPADPVKPAYRSALRCAGPTAQQNQIAGTYVDLFVCAR